MKRIKLTALLLIVVLTFAACGKKESVAPGLSDTKVSSTVPEYTESENTPSDKTETSESEASQEPVSFNETDDDMFTNRDQNTDYSESGAVKIILSDGGISCDSGLAEVYGNTVTIKGDGDFLIKGTVSDGQIIVDAGENDKPHLIFDSVEITSQTSAALYVKECDKLTVTFIGENTFSSGESFVNNGDENIDATIYSKQDLSFNGEGRIAIISPSGHGIVCKDDFVLIDLALDITCASHGINANDSVRVKAANINIASGKDGIHAENNDDETLGFIYISDITANIDAEGDGISAGNYLRIENGSLNINAGGGYENGEKKSSDNWGNMGGGMMPGGSKGGPGGRSGSATGINLTTNTEATESESESSSMKGMKACNNILINAGSFIIDSADDSLHSNLSIEINEGSFALKSGDDAVHAEESLKINGGVFDIEESYEGLEALNIEINGGDINIISSDDGLNAAGGTDQSGGGGRDNKFGGPMGGMMSAGNGSIIINGGSIYINAAGDGIDSNGCLEINSGYITVCGPTQGDTSVLDFDTSAEINGGTFIGTGASMMAQSFTGGSQGVIALSVGNQQAGVNITVSDSKGNELINENPALGFQIMIISSPDIIKGESYSVKIGNTGGTFEAK